MRKAIILSVFLIVLLGISNVNAKDKLEIFQDTYDDNYTDNSSALYQAKLDAAVRDDEGGTIQMDENCHIKWESSNPKIATINDEGFIKILDYGKAKMTVTFTVYGKVYKGSVTINSKDIEFLKDHSLYLKLTSPKEKISIGEKIKLNASAWQHINEAEISKIINDTELYIPKDVNYKLYMNEDLNQTNTVYENREYFRGIINNQVNWKIENIDDENSKDVIATIDENGILTAKKAGEIEITVTDKKDKDVYDTIGLDIVNNESTNIQNNSKKSILNNPNEVLFISSAIFVLIVEIVTIIILLKKKNSRRIK